MRLRLSLVVFACAALAQAAPAAPALQLQRVVLLMRHGIRPPTHEPALDPAIAPQAWPAWPVAPGDLTPHGAAAITLLGAFDRQYFGVLAPAGSCPAVMIHADTDERTLKTGQAYAAGFAPGCHLAVDHAAGTHDPLFAGLDTAGAGFNADTAKAAMLAAAGGDLAGPITANQALFGAMQNALEPGGKAFLGLPVGLKVSSPHRPPKLIGPLPEGASASEDFLLEYTEGKNLSEVGWGRVSKAGIASLLGLHPLEYTLTARPAYIAKASAAPLAQHIAGTLAGAGPVITVLVGHDTNIAELGGLLRLNWSLGGYPANDPPPGGGLVFSLLQDPSSHIKYVTITYQVQTMDQMRHLTPLTADHPPATQLLPIPGCGNAAVATACTLAQFQAVIQAATN